MRCPEANVHAVVTFQNPRGSHQPPVFTVPLSQESQRSQLLCMEKAARPYKRNDLVNQSPLITQRTSRELKSIVKVSSVSTEDRYIKCGIHKNRILLASEE